MELLQLRYFYESAMAESFSKAAEKYMVPASSVSASVRRLEQELGMELFSRTGNRVLLNEKGREFLRTTAKTRTLPVLSRPAEAMDYEEGELNARINGVLQIFYGGKDDVKNTPYLIGETT